MEDDSPGWGDSLFTWFTAAGAAIVAAYAGEDPALAARLALEVANKMAGDDDIIGNFTIHMYEHGGGVFA